MIWYVEFIGRKVGAIGIRYPISATCEGDTWEQAELDLYDRFEHITGLKIQERPEQQQLS